MNRVLLCLTRSFRMFCILLTVAPVFAAAADEAPPNVLLIMTDDQGYGDLSLHGNPYLKTPNLDRLGQSSIRAENFYVSPVCSPTRASLLTGRYHPRTGAISVTRRMEAMDTDEVTLAEIFKDNAYTTACLGKWHNGSYFPETPNAQGFDKFVGFLYGHITRYFDPPLVHNGQPMETDGYITDILTDSAIEFMKMAQVNKMPFFCYVAYNAPHTPGLAPEELINKYRDRGLSEADSAVYAMMDSVDTNVGLMLDHLDRAGLADNTIVIFLSDNGPQPFRYNAGMKGRKAWFDEGGVKVPFFIRWPDGLDGTFSFDQRLAHIDIFPTLVELCGLDLREGLELDGRSFYPLLTRPNPDWPDRLLYFFPFGSPEHADQQGAVRTSRWLALNRAGNWELYDLIEDPLQRNEVGSSNQWILEHLVDAYQTAFKEVYGNAGPTPIPVGYPDHPEILVEAPDANLVDTGDGGITYNFPAGFAHHWITGWTDPGAWPEWNLAVHSAGTYSVAIQYALKDDSHPVEASLETDSDSLAFRIEEAFHAETIPQPFFLPGEAVKYESRTWKMLPVGSIRLEEGLASMRLKLGNIPDSAHFELKGVRLVLQESSLP